MRSPGRRRAILSAACVSAVCLAAACSPTARYRFLTTIFDGVPVPPGVEGFDEYAALNAEDELSAFQKGIRDLRAQKAPRVVTPVILSVHQPVAEKKCRECHDMDRPNGGLRHDATLCDRCHLDQRQNEGWDHGPINLGTCIPCHEPHRSQYVRLLSEPVPQLCLNCHETVTPDFPEHHAVANFDNCIECHDPHRMY